MTARIRGYRREVATFTYQNQDYLIAERSMWPASVLTLNPDPDAEFIKVMESGLSLWDRAGYKVAFAFESLFEEPIALGVLGTDRHAAGFENQNCATLEDAEEFLLWALRNNRPSTEWEQWDRTHRYKQ